MVWEFQCPAIGCEYTASDNDEGPVIESAQQHMRDKHDDVSTREAVEEYVIGP